MEWMTMPLKRYAEFSGRSRRQEFWMWVLFLFLIGLVFSVLLITLGGGAIMGMMQGSTTGLAASGGAALIVLGLYFIFQLAVIIPNLAVTVRRLHDTNRSGWWILAPLAGYVIVIVGSVLHSSAVALVGFLVYAGLGIAVLVFMFLDGTPGPNNYGPDPKLRGEGIAPLAY